MLIKVKKYQVMTLPGLMRLVLRKVYEPWSLSSDDIDKLEYNVVQWSKKAVKTPWEEETIMGISWMLVKDEEGRFDKRKKQFKDLGIDWRKFHRLPEAFTVKDLLHGKELMDKDGSKFE